MARRYVTLVTVRVCGRGVWHAAAEEGELSSWRSLQVRAALASAVDLSKRTAERVRALAVEASAWWVECAPVGGEVERQRQRSVQHHVVRSLYERALSQLGLAHRGVVHSWMPQEAALALAASSLSLLGATPRISESERVCERVLHALVAAWASSSLNVLADERRLDAHHARRAQSVAMRWLSAAAGSRRDFVALLSRAREFWCLRASKAAAERWHCGRRKRQAHAKRMGVAVQCHASLLLRLGCAKWRARALELVATGKLLCVAAQHSGCVRGMRMWSRVLRCWQRERELDSRAMLAWRSRAQSVAMRCLSEAARSPSTEDGVVVIIHADAAVWYCGFDCDSGPIAKLPAIRGGGVDAMRKQLHAVFDEIDAVPSAHAVLFCEAAGTSTVDRESIAALLLGDLGVIAVHFAAAPLLAIYNNGFDTGVLVDVGPDAVHVYMLYAGMAVLDTASAYMTAHATELAVARACDAIVRTIGLADMSVRGALLGSIILVGSGSMAADFPSNLEAQLASALRGSVWKPHVKANVDRRYASWLGGAVFCTLPSAQRLFVSADDYKAGGAACLHERSMPLASTELEALERAHAVAVSARVDLSR